MKITDNFTGASYEIADYINLKLDGEDYDRGALEEARATADNCKKALANLITILQEKLNLSEEDIKAIVKG